MFDGKAKSTRQVSLSSRGSKTDSKNTKELLEAARKQREARAVDRQRNSSAVLIQKIVRSKVKRSRFQNALRGAFDAALGQYYSSEQSVGTDLLSTLPAFYNPRRDIQRLLETNQCVLNTLNRPEIVRELTDHLLSGESHGQSYLSKIVRCVRISIETLQNEVVSRILPHHGQPAWDDANIAFLLSFLTALELKEDLLGTYLALHLTKYTTRAHKTVTAALQSHNQGQGLYDNHPVYATCEGFLTVLKSSIGRAVAWGSDAAAVQQLPLQLRVALSSLRKVSS